MTPAELAYKTSAAVEDDRDVYKRQVLVLLTAIQILRPVQFSVFPSLILLLTLMRLSLDLASTRRILLHGDEGSSAAGKVIEAFGQFVVGGNYIVGFVIFIALIAIQYLVVSHGAVAGKLKLCLLYTSRCV